MDVAYEFEDAGDGGTLVRIQVGGDAGRFYRVAAPLMSRGVKRNLRRDLDNLERVIA